MQQDDTHLDESAPMKKIAGCYPPQALFHQFPLISVNSRKLFGAHGQGLRVVSPEEGDFYFYAKSITAFKQIKFWKTACNVLDLTSDFRHKKTHKVQSV